MIGKLVAFEISEFGESTPKTEFTFKATVSKSNRQRYSLGESSRKISKYDEELK